MSTNFLLMLKSNYKGRLKWISAIYLIILACLCSSAQAAERFIVDYTADEPDALRGDGICRTAAGGCSLRAALEESNALPGMDTVEIRNGTYPVTYRPITDYEHGEMFRALQIMDGLNLVGSANTLIDGQGSSSIMWARNHEALVIDSSAHQVSRVNISGDVAFSPFVDPDPSNINIPLNMVVGSPTGQTNEHDIYISTLGDGIKRFSDETGDFVNTFINPVVNGNTIIVADFVFHYNSAFGVLVADFSPGGGVLQFDSSGNFIKTLIPGSGFSQPTALLWHFFRDPASGLGTWGILVGDANSGRVDRYDENGNFVENIASNLHVIRDMITRGDTLYVSVEDRDSVETYDLNSGNYLGRFVDYSAGGLDEAGWLDWGPQGDLYVVSRGNNKVLAFDQTTGEYARTYIDGDSEGMNVGPIAFRKSLDNTGPGSNISSITIQNGRSTNLLFSAGFTNDVGSSTNFSNVRFIHNRSNTFGGAITNLGSMSINRSTIASNIVDQANTGGGVTARGGGIFSSGQLTINGSLIHDNSASKGGGISHYGGTSSSNLRISNSTISGNRSNGMGGGIDASNPNVTIENSTITLNQTAVEGGENNPYGGGIYVSPEGRVSLANTIIANNSDGRSYSSSDYSPDCYSDTEFALTSYRNNIIGVLNNNCFIKDYTWGDLRGIIYDIPRSDFDEDKIDWGILDLADNGGTTLTHALANSSPAIDAVTLGSPYDCEFDQIGQPRPADGNYDSISNCDIGAFEVHRQTTMLEAEDAELSGAFLSSTCEGASGGRCVSTFIQEVDHLESPNFSHKMVFHIYIENHWLYNIAGWVKGSAPDDNSFWVSSNGGTPFIWDISDTNGNFETQLINNRGTGTEGNPEVEAVSFLFDKGHHSIEIYVREDNAMLDRISITPVAIEPVQMLSMNQPTQASSISQPQFAAFNIVDGNNSTRWESAQSDSEWVQIDLEEPTQVSSVVLSWAQNFGEEYQIQISGDGETWVTLYEQNDGNGGVETLPVNGVGRYVRLQGISRGTSSAYSLVEMEVYGAPVVIAPSILEAEFSVSDDWGTGFCGSFLVTNNSSNSVTGWSLSVDLNGAVLRSDSWNGNFSANTGVITVEPGFSWNQTIPAGITDGSVGICADRSDPSNPTTPTILGTSP